MEFDLSVLGRNGVSVSEDVDNRKFFIDGSGGTEHHSAEATLTALHSTQHTNKNATGEVVIVLPPAIEGEVRSFVNVNGFNLKIVRKDDDVIQLGQVYPTGAAHIQSSEANAYLKLHCFVRGTWHVTTTQGEWSMGE